MSDALVQVHLVELELIMEAFPEFTQGLLSVKISDDSSDAESNVGAVGTRDIKNTVLGRISATSSVAFLFLHDDVDDSADNEDDKVVMGGIDTRMSSESSQEQIPEPEPSLSPEALTEGTNNLGAHQTALSSQFNDHLVHSEDTSRFEVDSDGKLLADSGVSDSSAFVRSHRWVELTHPFMKSKNGKRLVTIHQTSTDTAVELFIELSAADLFAYTDNSSPSSTVPGSSTMLVIFSIGASRHVDITNVVGEYLQRRIYEEKKNAEQAGQAINADVLDKTRIQTPLNLKGILSVGLHETTVSLIDPSKNADINNDND